MIAGGRVRAARRPAGWSAPGAPPAAPLDRPELWPAADEDLCFLAGDWRILQKRRGHRWSLDDLVTAAVAAEAVAEPRRILDLGCGIGAVLLLLAWRFPASRLVGVEAQAASVALARRSIEWNGCGERCAVRDGDLRDAAAFAAGEFNLVTGTPPYLPIGTATPPRRAEQPGCHLELRGGIEDYAAAAARALAPAGRFVVCHAARERLRVEHAAAAAGLVVERIRDVVPRVGKAPLFTVFTIRRDDGGAGTAPGRPSRFVGDGEARALADPDLVVRDRLGQRTAEFSALRRAMGMPP